MLAEALCAISVLALSQYYFYVWLLGSKATEEVRGFWTYEAWQALLEYPRGPLPITSCAVPSGLHDVNLRLEYASEVAKVEGNIPATVLTKRMQGAKPHSNKAGVGRDLGLYWDEGPTRPPRPRFPPVRYHRGF